jgi:hypothetical protein
MNGLKDANEGETDIRFTILSESRFHSRGAGVRVRVRNRDRTKWGPTHTLVFILLRQVKEGAVHTH